MPGGRPSTYDPMFCEMMIDYFETTANAPLRKRLSLSSKETGFDSKGAKGSQKREVRRICAELPTIEGFARSIGVSSQTVWKWSQAHAEFAEACTRAKDIQKLLIIDRMANREYDATAAIFIAQNITDMKARIEHSGEINTRGEVRISIELAGAPVPIGGAVNKVIDGKAEELP